MLRSGIFIVLLLLAGYGVVKAVPLLEGPELTLTSPVEGQSFSDHFVTVSGVAAHTENLSMNGAPLLIDEKGAFSTVLVLPQGGAILSLTATDRFGKSETVRRTIFVP
jgi:hypothetical protein